MEVNFGWWELFQSLLGAFVTGFVVKKFEGPDWAAAGFAMLAFLVSVFRG